MCQHKHRSPTSGLTSSTLCSRKCQDLLRLSIMSWCYFLRKRRFWPCNVGLLILTIIAYLNGNSIIEPAFRRENRQFNKKKYHFLNKISNILVGSRHAPPHSDCCVLPEVLCFIVKTIRATFIFRRNWVDKNPLCRIATRTSTQWMSCPSWTFMVASQND